MDGRPEEKYLSRLNALKNERKPWEDEWKNVTRLFYPRRNSWTVKPSVDKGGSEDIYDGEAIAALNLMCDGLLGNLIPASIPFIYLRTSFPQLEQIPILRSWLDACTLHIITALERSNFYLTMGEAFPDAGALGTSVVYMEEEVSSGRINFSSRHIKECYVAEDRYGRPNVLYRSFLMTLENLVEAFDDELDDEMRKRADDQPDSTIEILHATEKHDKAISEAFVLVSDTVKKGEKLIYQGERQYFPYSVWRFKKNSDEVYGRCPGMDAYWDIEMINNMAKTMAESAHKAADPPLLASESLRGTINMNPRGITYYDSRAGGPLVQPLYGNSLGQYPLGIDAMNRKAQVIRQHFRTDFFNYLLQEASGTGKERTATEINALEAQKTAILGATTGRITKELLEPIVQNVFKIEADAGRLPPLPEQLQQLRGVPLEIEYTGPLAKKQRQWLQSQDILDGVSAAAPMFQVQPEMMDNYNWDWISRNVSKAKGLPQDGFMDPAMVQKIRKARAEQQAAMQKAAMELEAAKVAPGLTKAPEPGSPAEKMNR